MTEQLTSSGLLSCRQRRSRERKSSHSTANDWHQASVLWSCEGRGCGQGTYSTCVDWPGEKLWTGAFQAFLQQDLSLCVSQAKAVCLTLFSSLNKSKLSQVLLDTFFHVDNWKSLKKSLTILFRNSSQIDRRRQWHPHSSTLAWKIPWTEEPGGPQSLGSLRVGQDSATSLSLFTFMHWRRKWQPTPVFLPGESQGWGSLMGCHLWGHTESDMTEAT